MFLRHLGISMKKEQISCTLLFTSQAFGAQSGQESELGKGNANRTRQSTLQEETQLEACALPWRSRVPRRRDLTQSICLPGSSCWINIWDPESIRKGWVGGWGWGKLGGLVCVSAFKDSGKQLGSSVLSWLLWISQMTCLSTLSSKRHSKVHPCIFSNLEHKGSEKCLCNPFWEA